MQRYRSFAPADNTPMTEGDSSLQGVDEYSTKENIPPGLVQSAVNIDFSTQDAGTRGGFVCIPSLGLASFNVSTGWTSRTSAADKAWLGMAYGNNRFVAVSGTAGTNDIMYSVDGLTWTSVTSGFSKLWSDVTFGNGLFVAVSDATGGTTNTVMYSSDGVTWTGANSAAARTWEGVVFGAGLFTAVCSDGTTQQVMTSPTGATWTIRSTPASQSGNAWRAIEFSSDLTLFVAVSSSGSGNRVMYSSDGITWTAGTSSANNNWSSVVWGSGTFVAVSNSGGTSACMTSPDGLTWTTRTTIAPSVFAEWRDVTYGSGLFVAVGAEGVAATAIMTSPNGITWTAATAPSTQQWYSVAYGASVGTFVAGPQSGGGTTVMTKTFYTTPSVAGAVLASGTYSDPDDPGSQWIMLVGSDRVGFYAFGKTSRSVSFGAGLTVSAQSTIVQCNNQVYIFRGTSSVPLYWTGDWAVSFALAPTPTPAAGFEIIANSNQATFYQNRLWVKNGKDTVSASDVLDFTTFDQLANDFNLNTGDSNFVVTTYPFGENSLIVFKNRSILVLQNVQGSLADVTVTEVTRQVGAIGINAVVSVGPDVVYMSDRNINLITLTSTNNAVQHKTLPLSQNISKIFNRVNWSYAYKVSMGFNDNKLYVSLPLDNATVCNSVVVYNFITGQWFGEWNFSSSIGMAIQGWAVATYLGLQRMHAITEDGRIFVTDEGPQDISGTTVAEISTSLTTRAYVMDNNNRVNRRMWADLSTWRPEFTITAYVDGASESSELITDQTYVRSSSFIFNDSTYTATNANDDYNRQGREDYAGYCSDSIQCQGGFLPQMNQDYRLPLLFRRAGRLVWFKVENSQGYISINSIGGEARAGARSSLLQVI